MVFKIISDKKEYLGKILPIIFLIFSLLLFVPLFIEIEAYWLNHVGYNSIENPSADAMR